MPGKPPSFVSTSLWQSPQACTLIRTCPTPGSGISRSTIWKSAPGLETCANFIVVIAIAVVAINPPMTFAAVVEQHFTATGEATEHGSPRLYPSTSKMTSNSTAVPSGRLATPYTRRQGFLSFPKTSCNNSEAASATFGCSRTSPEVATETPSRTIRATLSSDPKCCRATVRTLSAARWAALRPASTSSSAPTRPVNFAPRPSVGSIPLRKSRLPVCTASTYAPNGSGGAGSLMPSSFNRCSALAGGGPFRIADCAFEFAFVYLCPTILKSMLPSVAWQGSDHLSSTDRSVQLTQWSEYRAS